MIGGGVEAPRTPQRASAAGAGVAGSERRACMRERTSVPCSLLFAPMSSSSLASAPFECRNALPSPPVHPDECMSTAPPNAPSSPVRWIDGQAIEVLLRLAFSGPPCVPARLADSAGFRRAAAKKRASACGYEDAGRYSTQNSRSASRIAWIMAYYQDIFSIAIHQNAQPEPPEHALARFLAASRVNPTKMQIR